VVQVVQVGRETLALRVQVGRVVMAQTRLPGEPVIDKMLADRPVVQVLREAVQVIRVIPVTLVLRLQQFL
tara:strand:- start:419 stop:628 length:210 start_codon:yes stop_codon:yes gene_type:complete